MNQAFSPQVLTIENDTLKHRGHRGYQEAGGGQETHFSIFIVSSVFEGKSTLQRHQMVKRVLKDLLSSRVHAVSLCIKAPKEHYF